MATKQTDKSDTEQDIPGAYFGTDGLGREYHYVASSRTMYVEHDDGVASEHIRPPADRDEKPLLEYAIGVVEETGQPWEDVRLDPPHHLWLEGEVPIGEFPEGSA